MAKKNILTRSRKKKAFGLYEAGRLGEARALYTQVCNADKRDADAWYMRGVISGKLGEYQESEICCRRAIEIAPKHVQAYYNLGVALREAGQNDQSLAVFKDALSLDPSHRNALVCLTNGLYSIGRFEEAVELLHSCIERNPTDHELHSNLGAALQAMGRLEEAIACYHEALRLRSDDAGTYDNLGSALCAQGRYQDAVDHHRKALQIEPRRATALSNLLLTLHYLPGQTPEAVFREHSRWVASAMPPMPSTASFRNDRSQDRRLRVGYVSPDFRTHSVAYFIEPLLAAHDRENVEVFCYSTAPHPDETTHRLQSLADTWRATVNVNDQQFARQVQSDRIDILVDLAGHTACNRLGVFSLRPAPIQVTYLGYPDTTGLKTMDYRFTDGWADPPGSDNYYTERLVRLPGCFLCYKAMEDAPPVARLPADSHGAVTFGSFNNLVKINPDVVSVWAGLLREVPHSRLLVKSPALSDEAARRRCLAMFSEQGILPERVELMGKAPTTADHLAVYSQVDIGLDTFPYNGTTTTCEALWMGVPVITQSGSLHAGRVGSSLLHCLGLEEWVAETPEQYISIAAALASDLSRLAGLRAGLRERMAQSRLCDGKALARHIEAAYREMWLAWVQQ